jgi:predicted choloylglycine hydrolase
VIRVTQKSFASTKHSSHQRHSVYAYPRSSTIIAFTKANSNKDKFGNWKMSGPAAVLVTKSSATHCRPWEDGAEHICAIHRTHSEMVKFGPHDSDYNDVQERLKGLCRRAVTTRPRFQTSRSICM